MTMNTVKVYRFEKYDVNCDEWQTSRRWATEEAINAVGGRRKGDPVEVDSTMLGQEIDGMTDRSFNPHASHGFQRTVMR
jgi:hypothetical protein